MMLAFEWLPLSPFTPGALERPPPHPPPPAPPLRQDAPVNALLSHWINAGPLRHAAVNALMGPSGINVGGPSRVLPPCSVLSHVLAPIGLRFAGDCYRGKIANANLVHSFLDGIVGTPRAQTGAGGSPSQSPTAGASGGGTVGVSTGVGLSVSAAVRAQTKIAACRVACLIMGAASPPPLLLHSMLVSRCVTVGHGLYPAVPGHH